MVSEAMQMKNELVAELAYAKTVVPDQATSTIIIEDINLFFDKLIELNTTNGTDWGGIIEAVRARALKVFDKRRFLINDPEQARVERLDYLMKEVESVLGWVEARPVDPAVIAAVARKDRGLREIKDTLSLRDEVR